MSLTKLNLHLTDATLEVPLSQSIVSELNQQLDQLVQQFKTADRATKQPTWEYRHIGEVFFEVFCNPNIWANPLVARVLLTVRDERLRCTAEMSLAQLRQDIQEVLGQT
jgi:hypothetical protein